MKKESNIKTNLGKVEIISGIILGALLIINLNITIILEIVSFFLFGIIFLIVRKKKQYSGEGLEILIGILAILSTFVVDLIIVGIFLAILLTFSGFLNTFPQKRIKIKKRKPETRREKIENWIRELIGQSFCLPFGS
jgi:predicted membrane protein